MVDFTGGTWRSLIDGSEVSAIPDSPIGLNTIAYYQFTDDDDTSVLSDFEGSFDGSISGMSYVSDDDALRVVGEFDGDNDRVTGLNLSTLSEFTVGLIVKPLGLSGWSSADTIFSSRENNRFDIRVDDNNGLKWSVFHDDGGDNVILDSGVSLDENSLQTVVTRWDGSTLNISADGSDSASTNTGGMTGEGNGDGFGHRPSGNDRYANCRLVHVEISDQDEGSAFDDEFHALI